MKNNLIFIHNYKSTPLEFIKSINQFKFNFNVDIDLKDIICKDGRDAKSLLVDYIEQLDVESSTLYIIVKASIPKLSDSLIIFDYINSYNATHSTNSCKFAIVSKLITSENEAMYSNCFGVNVYASNHFNSLEFLKMLKSMFND